MHISLITKKIKQLIKPYSVLLIFIFLLAIFLRFWKIPEFFGFHFDEEYQALLAWEQVKNFHPIWIGVSASNVNFYLGPGFTYLNAFLFWLSKGDPIILAYFSAFWGIVTILSIYIVTKEIFSQKIAIFASIFYAFSSFIMYYDRRFWNDTPIPFVSIWMFYSLMKAKKDPRWLILSFILIATSLHIHLSLLMFWPIIIFVIIKNFRKIKLSSWFFMIISYIIIVSPLIVFDINHNFDNLLMPLRYFQKIGSSSYFSNILFNSKQLFKTLGKIWFLKLFANMQEEHGIGIHRLTTPPRTILSVLSLIILFWFFKESYKKKSYQLLSLILLSFNFISIFYPGELCDHFLLSFITLFFVATGVFFSQLPKFICLPIITIFIVANSLIIFTTTQEQYGLLTRKNLIKKLMPYISNQSFYLETISPDKRKYHSSGGWRYLFKAYGKTPAQSHADDFFGWIYPDEISKEKPKLRVVISEYEAKLKEKPMAKFQSGVYYGYILKN